MNFETLQIDSDDDGVTTLTLNRPDKHNALSAQMIDDLTQFAESISKTDNTRAVVLTAAGKTFCAGGDLKWMHEQIQADRQTRMREARKLAMMLNALNELPVPLIGRVHGNSFGGGIGMMSVCDVVIAANTARFGLTETRLGLIPATISPYVMARMGEGLARRVFMSARLFDAEEAVALQLVAKAVEPDALDAAVAEEVKPYLSVSAEAVKRAKALARSLGPTINEATIDHTIELLADSWETADAAEGIDAFLNKRPAAWVCGSR